MQKGPFRPLGLALVLLLGGAVRAQSDTTAIGGADGTSTFEEGGDGVPLEHVEESMFLGVEDSLLVIPGHELYREWNTDVIFGKRATVSDTVRLMLAHSACDHSMPVCGNITSPFGMRRSRMHYGVDIKLQVGDAVVSAFEGLVRISRYHGQYGEVVVVRHPNGLETLYAHLSKRSVQVGDRVEAGEVIGLGGSTGRSTGSHLHFETRYLGQPIDPQTIFDVQEGELRANTLALHAGSFTAVERAKAAAVAKRFHNVRRGDTLSAISRRYSVPLTKLCKLNRISKRSVLRVGQRLRYR
jgi:hypothetical protein